MATSGVATRKHKITVVGGSAIAKIVSENAKANPDIFETEVQMWVYEEEVTVPKDSKHYKADSPLCQGPQKLTKLINELHENIKYLPNIALPTNLIANPSLEEAAKEATILIFNLPHQFIGRVCDTLKGKIIPFARGISCIKGVDVSDKGIQLFSESIGSKLGIYCGALSGANVANEVAQEKFSGTTVAYDPPRFDSQHPATHGSPKLSPVDMIVSSSNEAQKQNKLHAMPNEYPPLNRENMKKLFDRPYFHVRIISDVAGVSLSGALKNIVALAVGFVDGLGWGGNAKSAVILAGILEQVKFGQTFFEGKVEIATFTLTSCGVADMITSCMGGRNFRCASMSVQEGLPIGQIEERELNGQKLQGTSTAYDVNAFLKMQNMEHEFPLFTVVYEILEGRAKPEDIPQSIAIYND
ncbi:MAG: glycerol-3-phosphate dehydrogenase [Bogoriella megaspora]|nr:MAG: glycerol-3-phosphate dehydrogenase [Bogoriella megaspora]